MSARPTSLERDVGIEYPCDPSAVVKILSDLAASCESKSEEYRRSLLATSQAVSQVLKKVSYEFLMASRRLDCISESLRR